MSSREERLRNLLRESEQRSESFDGETDEREENPELRRRYKSSKRRFKNMLGFGLIAIMLLFLFNRPGSDSFNPVNWINTTFITTGPSEDLLNRMNSRMVEMGYTGLTSDELRQLRADGLTATYISNVRALGYDDLSLEDAVRIAKAGASSRYIAMMIELGYPLSIDDIVTLRDAGVTAHFTSNIHDLGYRDVTLEQLIRLRRIGVTPALIKRLHSERGEDISLEEIIRYRISNQ